MLLCLAEGRGCFFDIMILTLLGILNKYKNTKVFVLFTGSAYIGRYAAVRERLLATTFLSLNHFIAGEVLYSIHTLKDFNRQ